MGRPAAANEDSTALLTWLTSEYKAPVGDVAATRAVITLALLASGLPVTTEAVPGETKLDSVPKIAEPGLLDTSVDTKLGTAEETDSWPTRPPKGDSDMNVGVELSNSEDAAELIDPLRLLTRKLTFEVMLAVKAGGPISVVLCRPAAEVEEAPEPVNTAVTLFSIMVMDDCDP